MKFDNVSWSYDNLDNLLGPRPSFNLTRRVTVRRSMRCYEGVWTPRAFDFISNGFTFASVDKNGDIRGRVPSYGVTPGLLKDLLKVLKDNDEDVESIQMDTEGVYFSRFNDEDVYAITDVWDTLA